MLSSLRIHRYETFWLNFMADELALRPDTLVVAHGTAADALLRFLEKREASVVSFSSFKSLYL